MRSQQRGKQCSARSHVPLSFPSPFQVYNVASGKALPQWLSDKKKRALRKDDDYR